MVYKKTSINPVTSDTVKGNAQRWLGIVKYSESGVVIQPQDDCEYRVGEILRNSTLLKKYLGPYYKKYILSYVNLGSQKLSVAIRDSIINELKSRKVSTKLRDLALVDLVDKLVDKGYNLGVFVSGLGKKDYDDLYSEMKEVEKILENSHNFSVIAFSERNIVSNKYSLLVDGCSLLFDHVEFYPLYGKPDSEQFLKYNESMWDEELDDITKNEIIEKCGGYLWLISHVQRKFRDNPNTTWGEIEADPGLAIKLEAILVKLGPEELKVLEVIAWSGVIDGVVGSREYEYLYKVGLVVESNGGVRLGVPLLLGAINRHREVNRVEADGKRLIIEGNDVSRDLSEMELTTINKLITNKGEIVAREQLAEAIWGIQWQEKYTDWALDRLMSRLRKKLQALGINPKLIRTIKRKGYIFG